LKRQPGFVFGSVFPPDDLLSEWMATLSIAFNDLALVHIRLDEDYNTPHRFLYWLRLAIAHYNEAGVYLDRSSQVDEVKSFVLSLPPETQNRYADCLERYRSRKGQLERLRSEAAFHYPELRPERRKRPMKAVLDCLAGEVGRIDKGESGKVRDSRLLYADDISSRVFISASGGEEALEAVHRDIEAGITAFMRFTNAALDEWFALRAEAGAKFFALPAGRSGWQEK
jgi:hypothetical protein